MATLYGLVTAVAILAGDDGDGLEFIEDGTTAAARNNIQRQKKAFAKFDGWFADGTIIKMTLDRNRTPSLTVSEKFYDLDAGEQEYAATQATVALRDKAKSKACRVILDDGTKNGTEIARLVPGRKFKPAVLKVAKPARGAPTR